VPEPKPGQTLAVENGILGREALLRQARAARAAIEKHRPDRIVTLGGDCLVDLAPIAYLNSDQYDDRGQAPKTIDFACCEALNASWTRHGFAPTFTPA
jgi:alcohol dehydrogenase class IV